MTEFDFSFCKFKYYFIDMIPYFHQIFWCYGHCYVYMFAIKV